MKQDIKSMSLEQLKEFMLALGEKPFRAEQIFAWLHKAVTSFDEMSNLSKALREKLEQEAYITVPELIRKQESKADGTLKYLWRLSGGDCVETVFMRYSHGNSVCISSQVGCRMGCAFCASTIGGLDRSLPASEILDQVLFTEKDAGAPVSNIVLMGIGEPMDNFDNVLRFLELVTSPKGRNIGYRHISLSTCGMVEKIDKLAQYKLQLTLSISLHAPDDETRSNIMPINHRHPVAELMEACRRYHETTGRRISYEYAMIDGVNDSLEQADMVAELLRGQHAHVNLIPLNDVAESPLKPSRNLPAFQARLEARGVNVTVRRRLGRDIDAACGQLRRSHACQNRS